MLHSLDRLAAAVWRLHRGLASHRFVRGGQERDDAEDSYSLQALVYAALASGLQYSEWPPKRRTPLIAWCSKNTCSLAFALCRRATTDHRYFAQLPPRSSA